MNQSEDRELGITLHMILDTARLLTKYWEFHIAFWDRNTEETFKDIQSVFFMKIMI